MAQLAAIESWCDHRDTMECTTEADVDARQRRWLCPDCGWGWTEGLEEAVARAGWTVRGARPDVVLVFEKDEIPF